MPSTTIKIAAAALVVVLAAVVLYAALTFPIDVIDFQVSFTAGLDREEKDFDVPILQNKALVQVSVTSGTALWRATILDANGSLVWEHPSLQGDSTTYQSGWIVLPSGHYNFTFRTIGFGNLDAGVKITSKGGFW